jgi:hypothetical protein
MASEGDLDVLDDSQEMTNRKDAKNDARNA